MSPRYHIVLNSHSGSASGVDAQRLGALFDQHGHEATIDAETEAPLEARVRRAVDSAAPIVVAAGGDGTVTALAKAAMDSRKQLAILPLGTANLLARDLGLPLDVEAWVAQLREMEPRRIDVGEVNGRVFLHKVVLGTIPGIAAVREEIRDRPGLMSRLAFLAYFARRLARARRIAVEVTPSDGPPHIERVQSIAIGNNSYDEGIGRFFSRSRLDAGRLSVYVLKHLGFDDVMRLAAGMLLGTWRHDEVLEIDDVRALTLRLKRRKVRVMLDGEIAMLDAPLHFTLRPRALSVVAPPLVTAPEPATDIAAQPI